MKVKGLLRSLKAGTFVEVLLYVLKENVCGGKKISGRPPVVWGKKELGIPVTLTLTNRTQK